MTPITGGCACGAVRYECNADPIMAAHCFCRDCQRSSGTAMASEILVPAAALKVSGELKVHEVIGGSGSKVHRSFCPNCGSPILLQILADPKHVAITAGSLDDPAIFQPKMQVFVSSAPGWAVLRDDIPKM